MDVIRDCISAFRFHLREPSLSEFTAQLFQNPFDMVLATI
jgi:hypothetical protein